FIVAGLPILAADMPELIRFVTVNEIGINRDLTTSSSFLAALREFLESNLPRFRQKAKLISPEYQWEVQTDTVLQIYEQALGAQDVPQTTQRETKTPAKKKVLVVINYPTRDELRPTVRDLIYETLAVDEFEVSYLNTFYPDGAPPKFYQT